LPDFVVRVVLHGAKDPEDYNDFHEEMEAKHYYRTITSDEGVTFELPPATYRAGGVDWTMEMIRAEVRAIADATGFSNAVLVTESNGSAWIGLGIA